VNNGNSQYSPFKIIITPEKLSNNTIDVKIKILRDPADVTTFNNLKLRIALTEKQVYVVNPSCCTNGETHFYSVCRKMLPDGYGFTFEIPAPGDSVEMSYQYIPSAEFLNAVNLDSIRVAAFLQDHCTKEVYQSEMTDLISADRVNAAFSLTDNLGASPLQVDFTDYSTASGSNNIVSWEWDFNNDGTIDSNVPNPTWTYDDEQSYTVSLTVSDGTQQHTRKIENCVTVLGTTADILVVNGIAYATYGAQMKNLYDSSACFGSHEVDLWDLFGDQCYNWATNSQIKSVRMYSRDIPASILKLYDKVIWLGNSYSGDEVFFNADQVLEYIANGGNFLLATREGGDFLKPVLKTYCGITSISGLSSLPKLISMDDSLVNVQAVGTNDRNQFVQLDASSEAIPIFDDNAATNFIAGFRIKKLNEGAFIYIAGRPYRFVNSALYHNYNYIIKNYMTSPPTDNEEQLNSNIPVEYELAQCYPNPFNPSTRINYSLPSSGNVTLKVYDVIGNVVATLVDEYKNEGVYELNFNASSLASGIYFYRLSVNEFSDVKKMILIK
jgi:PKD repeat protein